MARRRELVLLAVSFGIFGMMWGLWAVTLADLVKDLRLSDAEFGASYAAITLVAMPVMISGGALARRVSLRVWLLVGSLLMAGAFLMMSQVSALFALVGCLMVIGAGSGLYDLVTNILAVRYEQETGKIVLTPLHACFSGGGMLGAITSALLLNAGVSFRLVYLVIAALMVLMAVLSTRFHFASHRQEERTASSTSWTAAYRNIVVVMLGIAIALGFACESSMESWSAIYLSNALGFAIIVGGGGVAAFHSSMFIGRLIATKLVNSFGPRTVLRCAGLSAAVCMVVGLSTTNPVVILLGFFGVGLSLSAIVPTVFTITGQVSGEHSAQASSLVITLGYLGFLTAAPIIGGLSNIVGLRLALGTISVIGLVITALAFAISRAPVVSRAPREIAPEIAPEAVAIDES